MVDDGDRRTAWMNDRLSPSRGPAGSTSGPSEHPETCDRALAAWHAAQFDGAVDGRSLRRAASLYEESARTRPEDLHAYVDAATIYEALGDHSRAADLWRRAGEGDAGLQVARMHSRRLELLASIEEEKVAGYEKAVALVEISRLYRAIGDFERSMEFARLALEVDERQATAWADLAEVYLEVGLFDEAEDAAQRARALTRQPDRDS
jgi:tetratricopeptide (TPR) repeat protein